MRFLNKQEVKRITTLSYAEIDRREKLKRRGGRLVRYSVSPLLSGFPAGWLRNVLLLGCRAGRA